MAAGNNRASAQLSPLMKVLRILYWVVFAISLVIVILFIIFKLFVKPPEVPDTNEIDVPGQVTIIVPGNSDPNASDPGSQESQAPQQVVLNRKEGVYTCLLAGTDDGNGNADTVMLGVFDTVGMKASLISIPRDTLVSVNGKNWKINATYSLGGLDLMCDTVSDMLAIPVDFYVAVDLAAMEAIIDEVGGVWFTVPPGMQYSDPTQDLYINIAPGYQLLDGATAVNMLRCRSAYANQDVGRAETQRAFLVAMVKQTISLSNVDKVTSLINILNQYVDSNMPLNNMIYFATRAIGMDLNTNMTTAILPSEWIYPFMELKDEKVLELVNSLGIYQEEVPMEVLDIHHREAE